MTRGGVEERVRADGTVETPLDIGAVKPVIGQARTEGIDAVAIVFMHAWKFPAHEKAVSALCRHAGFAQLSVSHDVSPLVKLVRRAAPTAGSRRSRPATRPCSTPTMR